MFVGERRTRFSNTAISGTGRRFDRLCGVGPVGSVAIRTVGRYLGRAFLRIARGSVQWWAAVARGGVMRIPKILVVTVLLAFSAAHQGWANVLVDDALKSAARFEQTGEAINAAEAYARVLRLEPGNQKAKKGLGRVAEEAMSAKISAAR
jgi:hypothetical protein